MAYCRWSEQRRGSGRLGTRPPDRRTKGPGRAEGNWKADKRLRRRVLSGMAGGWEEAEPGPVHMHWGPGCWRAAGPRPCVVHYHTQRAASTPPSMGRRMPPCWLPRNVVRKAQRTKALAPLGEGHWKGCWSMPVWVNSSSEEDNGADRCWGKTDKKTEPERGDGWVWVWRWMGSIKKGETLLRSQQLPGGSTRSIYVLLFELACLLAEQTMEPYRVNMVMLNW